MLVLLTLISAYLYSSLIEYCLHRFVQHRTYEVDHIKYHHKIFHGVKSYELEEAKAEDILLDGKGILLNAALYLIPSAAIVTQDIGFAVLFLASCIIYNLWEECVHLYSHKSSGVFFEKFSLFRRLKEHHRVHHYIYNSNYGIGSTVWDVVFRTKKSANKSLEAIMRRVIN